MKPSSKRTITDERNLDASNKNTINPSTKNQTSENKKYESKTRNSGSPRKHDKSKDSRKDLFALNAIEKRFVFDDEDNEYEYESANNEANKSSKNSQRKTNSPRAQLSPRKQKIVQKILKLEAELKELQSSVISGLTNENSESLNDVAQKIDAKKKKLNELEKLAELEKREIKEENENKELRRRIEILEKNQEEIMSPKHKPNLGFMSPHDAIVSIKAQPFEQLKEGSSLIERRKQDPLNVEVANPQSNKQSAKKKEKKQAQERGISLSSEKKLNESSFCQMNPIDAKNFADKHIEDIVSSDAKKYSSHPVSRAKNLSNHDSNYKSNSSTRKHNEPERHHQRTPTQKDQRSHHRDSEQDKYPKYSSSHSNKQQSPKKQNTIRSEKPKIITRSADIQEDSFDFDRDLSVDVTIVEVKKIPDASIYCVIFTEANKESANKTKVVNREADSNILNEDFHFEFNRSIPKSDVLVVIVKKEDLLKGDKIIGTVKIDLTAVIRSMNRKKVNVLDKIFPILAESKVQTEGRLHLILQSDCVDSANGNKRNRRRPKKEKQEQKKSAENRVEKPQKTPSVSDNKSNSINEDIVLERDQQIEPENMENEEPQGQNQQINLSHSESNASENQSSNQRPKTAKKDDEERMLSGNSYSSQNRSHKSNSSHNQKPNSNSNQIKNENSYSSQKQKPSLNSSQIKNENSYSSQKQQPQSINNNTKPQSPKSPKYNWNNGSLINKSNKKKRPIFEILSEDEEEPEEPQQDTFDENAPTLNPSSFPVPEIKYPSSVEAEIERENEMKDQMTLSLQDILQQTGSPVRARDIDFIFGNESAHEEEEEENKSEESLFNLSEGADSPIEPVSEDEDQINTQLDKKFGKEPPRLSSAEPSEINHAINKSEDAVTFNLCDLAKYYEPRFHDTVPQQRRNERKQKQKLMENKNIANRSINLSSDEEEENDEDQINAQFEDNFNAMKKKQRITKVQSSDELLISDDNDVQLGFLPIDDDDDDDIQIKSREAPKPERKEEKEEDQENKKENEDENEKKSQKEEDDADISIESQPSHQSSDNEEESKDKIEAETESIGPLELDCFSSNDPSKPSKPKPNADDKFDQIEIVESSNPKNLSQNQKSSSINSIISSSISGISLIAETSSFTDNSIKSSLSQFAFVESVKKIDGKGNNDDNQFNSDE